MPLPYGIESYVDDCGNILFYPTSGTAGQPLMVLDPDSFLALAREILKLQTGENDASDYDCQTYRGQFSTLTNIHGEPWEDAALRGEDTLNRHDGSGCPARKPTEQDPG